MMIFSGFSLVGKTALVTGASRGIGRAIAVTLAEAGAYVIGTATTDDGAAAIQQYFAAKGLQGTGKLLNVTELPSIEALLATIKGPDILVNNAAITRDNLLLRMKEEEWALVIETNLTAVYRLTKLCLRAMLKTRWGRIINISSISGVMGNMGQANYAAAKAGVLGLTKALALEVATRNITVNAVAPGFIDTDMTKNLPTDQREWLLSKIACQRLGSPEEIAAVVAFLASPSASYVTGETIQVNGGMYMQ